MRRRALPVLHPAGILVGALLTGLGLVIAEAFVGPLIKTSMEEPEQQVLGLVHERLSEDYVEERDRTWLLHRAVEGMVAGLEDPYTFFIGPESLVDLEEESSGSLIGIGVVLNLDTHHVRYPMPGGPAEEAGIRPGDLVLAVDGESVVGLDGDALASRIKGPAGTEVHLELESHEGDRRSAVVKRGSVPTGTVGKIELVDVDHGIGWVHVRSFARSTPQELESALRTLQDRGLRGLILDLRFNTGGVLDAAVDMAAEFIGDEPVCTLLGRDGEPRVRNGGAESNFGEDLPVAILINHYSASGSEVLAGALRDHGAAVLVGSPSYGKGVYQQVHRYPDWDFAFKFTAGYYLTPSGHVLEGNIDPERAGGLEPDVWIPTAPETDAALLNWLRYDAPPERYRELVYRLFPRVAEYTGPRDPAFEAAHSLLVRALGASTS